MSDTVTVSVDDIFAAWLGVGNALADEGSWRAAERLFDAATEARLTGGERVSRFKHEDEMTEADMVRTDDQYSEHQRQSEESESMAITRARASGIIGAALSLTPTNQEKDRE